VRQRGGPSPWCDSRAEYNQCWGHSGLLSIKHDVRGHPAHKRRYKCKCKPWRTESTHTSRDAEEWSNDHSDVAEQDPSLAQLAVAAVADACQDRDLRRLGYTVVRLNADDITRETERTLDHLHLNPRIECAMRKLFTDHQTTHCRPARRGR